MTQAKFLFISRRSSHYRYYQKLVSYLNGTGELKKLRTWVFPRFNYWQQVNQLDINDLVDVHLKRKEVRHPLIKNNPLINKIVRGFYTLREKSRASYYFELFAGHDCETVILWNGMKQPNRTPYVVAKASGKKTQLFENGLLPNTTVLDPKGVNAYNSMPRTAQFYLNWRGNNEQMDTQLVVRNPHKNRKTEAEQTTIPDRYIFVPFQVPNDTQVVCHSPWIKDMDTLYQALDSALEFLSLQPEGQSYKFVVKEHPSWPRSFQHLHNGNPNIIFANNNNTQELIENAIAVCTINSTVGIESLLLNKRVITLGNAFYNIEGIVHHCHEQLAFNNTLLTIEQQKVNSQLISQFLNYMKQEYLLPQSWNKITNEKEHFAAVEQRLNMPYEAEQTSEV